MAHGGRDDLGAERFHSPVGAPWHMAPTGTGGRTSAVGRLPTLSHTPANLSAGNAVPSSGAAGQPRGLPPAETKTCPQPPPLKQETHTEGSEASKQLQEEEKTEPAKEEKPGEPTELGWQETKR